LNSIATLPTVTPAVGGSFPTAPLHPSLPSALQRACIAAKTAQDNKGSNIVVLDLRRLTPMFDYFVISTGASRRQVHTITEETDAALRAVGDKRLAVEGYETSKWIVQDYGDVMVHVFDSETRDYYNLEDLWADAEKIDWEQEID
jgi:ribosome-associated protein